MTNLEKNWPAIRTLVQDASRSSFHCAFSTVDADGSPHITPIGSLILRDDCTGYYFEEYTRRMPVHFAHNRRVCILAVHSGFAFFLKSLIRGRFSRYPGVRLYGQAGERRPATDEEIATWQKRVRMARGTKGYELLWKNLRMVRDIRFDSFDPVTAGEMTREAGWSAL